MPALAADGKRIRGASSNGDSHYEPVTLVEHDSGVPKASCSFCNEGKELDVTRQLLSDVDITDRTFTWDGLYSTFESVELILITNRPTVV